ncbi:MAG: hypothetical protein AAF356_10295 [Planctomycetota bacterium]
MPVQTIPVRSAAAPSMPARPTATGGSRPATFAAPVALDQTHESSGLGLALGMLGYVASIPVVMLAMVGAMALTHVL